jgi:hypothetical protein
LLKFRLLKCQAERDIQADIEELENEPQRAAQIAVNRLLGYHGSDLRSKTTTNSNGWVSRINREVLKGDDGFLPHIPGEREEKEKEEREKEERDRLVVPKIWIVSCPVRPRLAKPYPSSGFGKKSRKIEPNQTSVRLKIYKSTPEMQKEKIKYLNQEFKHIHSIDRMRLEGPYRVRVAFLKKEEVFFNTDYDEEGSYNTTKGTHVYDILKLIRYQRKLKGQRKALTSVITGNKILSDAEAKELRRNYFALHSAQEEEVDDTEEEHSLVFAEAKELKQMADWCHNPNQPVVSDGVATARNYFTRPLAPVEEDANKDLYQDTMEYRKFIGSSCSMSKNRNKWLNPNSILKSTTISTPDYKSVEFWSSFCYGRDIPRDSVLRILPRPQKIKSNKNGWSCLPTRAFANVMNFLESSQTQLCWSEICSGLDLPRIKTEALLPPPRYFPSEKFASATSTYHTSYWAFRSRIAIVRKKVEDDLANNQHDKVKTKNVRFFKQYEKKISHHSDMSKEQKDLLWKWHGPGKCSWVYAYEIDHKDREEQLVLYAKFYDISKYAASKAREYLLGGRITTIIPESSMQHATSWAAIHWETYQDYNNEKSTITWKKNGTGKWAGSIQDAVYPEVIQALDFKLSESNYDARLRLVLKQTAEKFDEWKKKKLTTGTQLKIDDTERTDTNNNSKKDRKHVRVLSEDPFLIRLVTKKEKDYRAHYYITSDSDSDSDSDSEETEIARSGSNHSNRGSKNNTSTNRMSALASSDTTAKKKNLSSAATKKKRKKNRFNNFSSTDTIKKRKRVLPPTDSTRQTINRSNNFSSTDTIKKRKKVLLPTDSTRQTISASQRKLFVPALATNMDYWTHVRLVADNKRENPTTLRHGISYYCTLCKGIDHNFTPGYTTQIKRHVEGVEHRNKLMCWEN